MKDQDTSNYYQVIADQKMISKIHPDTSKKSYVLASGLSNGKHTLELFKRTEWDKGKTMFYGFMPIKEASVLAASALPKHKIEFYGNSITCGYATEDYKDDSPLVITKITILATPPSPRAILMRNIPALPKAESAFY